MFKTFTAALALTTALALAAAPASARDHHHGFGLAALAVGVIGGAIGASFEARSEPVYQERECYMRSQAFYDDYGDYLGRRSVKVCD